MTFLFVLALKVRRFSFFDLILSCNRLLLLKKCVMVYYLPDFEMILFVVAHKG